MSAGSPSAAREREALITLAVPCRTDEPSLGRTLEAALAGWHTAPQAASAALEILVCLNGAGAAGSRALADLRALAARHGAPCPLVDADAGGGWPAPVAPLGVLALATRREGKPVAWNLLRGGARSAIAVFLDADVDLGPGAIGLLLAALERHPEAAVASAKTTCAPRGTAFERIMAAPYAIDWPNLSGQLYAVRLAALPARMPEDVLIDERWLELTLGHQRVVRVPEARVLVRLPATLRDFVRQRVRIELGKVQLARAYAGLETRSAPQPGAWSALRSLGPANAARAAVYLALRHACRLVAERRWRTGRTAGVWRQAESTKRWDAA